MPTAGRLFGAIPLAALAWLVSMMLIPLLPEGMQPGRMPVTNVVIGLLMGWIVLGGRAGRGWSSGIGAGLTAVAALIFWSLLWHGGSEMISRSLNRRYDGPAEAVIATFEIMIDYGALLLNPQILGALIGGGIVVGLIAEFAGQRWR